MRQEGSRPGRHRDKSFAPEQYGVAIKKGNADLVAKINKGLADIKTDGTSDKLDRTIGTTRFD